MFRLAAAALVAALALPALADDALSVAAGQTAGLAGPTHDMTMTVAETADGALDVRASFAPVAGGKSLRVAMGLGDGDATAFSMPGDKQELWRFARVGDAVEVTVTPAPLRFAAN